MLYLQTGNFLQILVGNANLYFILNIVWLISFEVLALYVKDVFFFPEFAKYYQ